MAVPPCQFIPFRAFRDISENPNVEITTHEIFCSDIQVDFDFVKSKHSSTYLFSIPTVITSYDRSFGRLVIYTHNAILFNNA